MWLWGSPFVPCHVPALSRALVRRPGSLEACIWRRTSWTDSVSEDRCLYIPMGTSGPS